MLVGSSLINHPFWYPIYGNHHKLNGNIFFPQSGTSCITQTHGPLKVDLRTQSLITLSERCLSETALKPENATSLLQCKLFLSGLSRLAALLPANSGLV